MLPDPGPVLDAVTTHVERHIGPVDQVFHELVSEAFHLDVLFVGPREGRPWQTLVTCGMSTVPMADGARAELYLGLPPDWPLDDDALRAGERHYWPIRLLKDLARAPHEHETFLRTWHTVANGDPAEPYADETELCGALIAPPMTAPEAFEQLSGPDGPVDVYAVVPLYRQELELKLTAGIEALVDALDDAAVGDVVIRDRPSAV